MIDRLRSDISVRRVHEMYAFAVGLYDTPPFHLDAPYQRGAVWTVEQQRNLFLSLLRELPIGAIFVNHRAGGYETYVVDGQQRLRAVIALFQGELDLPTDWVDNRGQDDYPAWVPEEYDATTINYKQMTKAGQMHFKSMTIGFIETKLTTVQDEAELFNLINFGGSPMTDDDRQRAAAVREG